MFIRGAIATCPGEGKREGNAEEQKRRVAKKGQELFLLGHQVYVNICGALVQMCTCVVCIYSVWGAPQLISVFMKSPHKTQR